ncbi:precorrin-6A synthase (deacetylating) [Aureimonas fodinaquatilis]|uniref:Precorrin-6A synthase [deacetylating] n=1 Tax=Aureimonas fodinaquatilis TaxID=2565783 RepID=A0A5B0DWG5_9HYPH|nr:precorrin-6A synthase (deacetylating) [Aureimonas fodinaquatilis]KAA0969539.1 precorrin-6A synthase (deacetylating) [Aureimonas fodinaquatilis]
MIELDLIGIGTGNPDHLTLQAIKALNAADVVVIPRKGNDKADLADLRRDICTSVLSGSTRIVEFDMPVRNPAIADYQERVAAWHAAIAALWAQTIETAVGAQGRVALLIWGDPGLYDSSLRIAAQLDVRINVIPGITSLQALGAAHGIPINDVGAPFLVTTGRQLRDHGWPQGVDTVIVMLDGECSFQHIAPGGISIWWGAYVGMQQEITLSGPLATMAATIMTTRQAARAQHGWIMDIYLMRRTAGPEIA